MCIPGGCEKSISSFETRFFLVPFLLELMIGDSISMEFFGNGDGFQLGNLISFYFRHASSQASISGSQISFVSFPNKMTRFINIIWVFPKIVLAQEQAFAW